MKSPTDPVRSRAARRRRGTRGDELMEMSLVLLPLLAMIFVTLDIAWGVYNKATLEHALRVGVRYGITNHLGNPYLPSLCLTSTTMTDCIGQHVIWAAGGNGVSGGLLDGAQVVGPGGTCGSPKCIMVNYTGPNNTLNGGGNVLTVTITGKQGGSGSPVGFAIPTLITPFIAPTSIAYTVMSSADSVSSVLSYPTP